MSNINGYTLTKNWFNWSFENPELNKPTHTALYMWILDKWNRSGQKDKISLPTSESMEAIGIKSYNTYKKTLLELIEFGFIKMVQESKNQYTCNIIALSNFDKAHDKALDKALTKHITKQSESTIQSTDSIYKLLNYMNEETIELLNSKKDLIELNLKKWIEQEENILKEKESTALSIPDKDIFVEFGLLKAKEYEYNVSRSSLLKKYDYWNSSNWINQKTKEPILNWKTTLINSLKYLNENNINNSTNAVKNINLAGDYEVKLDANNEPIAPMFKDYKLDFLTYNRHYNIYAEYCKKNGLEIKYKKADWS